MNDMVKRHVLVEIPTVEVQPGPNNMGFPSGAALVPGKVTLWHDGWYDCWLDPDQRWNGWACPYFTYEQAMAFCEAWNRQAIGQVGKGYMRAWYDHESEQFWIMLDDVGEKGHYEDPQDLGSWVTEAEWSMDDPDVKDSDIPEFMFTRVGACEYATTPEGEPLYDFSLGLCWSVKGGFTKTSARRRNRR